MQVCPRIWVAAGEFPGHGSGAAVHPTTAKSTKSATSRASKSKETEPLVARHPSMTQLEIKYDNFVNFVVSFSLRKEHKFHFSAKDGSSYLEGKKRHLQP